MVFTPYSGLFSTGNDFRFSIGQYSLFYIVYSQFLVQGDGGILDIFILKLSTEMHKSIHTPLVSSVPRIS